MSRSQLPNQEQTHNIDEAISETQEEYDQLEKISDPEPRIAELYPKQSGSKIYDDGELAEVLSSPSPEPFRRNLALEFEETLAENTQDLNQDEAKQLFENLGMKKLIISPCNSSFSVQISYDDEEALETNKNQDESLSFEEQQPGHYTVRSRAGGITQRNIAEDLPEIPKNPFIKEISNYEVCSDSEVSRTENMTPSEDNVRENTNKKFDCLSKSFEEIEYKNRLLILTDTSKLFEFLGESGQAAITKEFLWKYIFYLQEHISANKEVYERKISELQQEVTQKDSLLHELMKKQQKVDLNAEMKYYENLQLAHNPRKLIAKLKIAHLGQENKDINSEKYNSGPKAILELSNVKTNHRYNLPSSYASLPKKSPTNATLENFRRLKLPLLDVSTNQSLESLDEQAELNFTGKYYGGEPEAFFSTGESHSSVSIKHGEDEVIFSSQDNFKTYFNNLQETLEVMKENNCLIQAENLQLKECIKSLRDETATLKKENERIRGQQKSAQKSKDTRNFQPVGGASLKWANTKKFHELEQQNKHSLERFKSFSITAKSIKV